MKYKPRFLLIVTILLLMLTTVLAACDSSETTGDNSGKPVLRILSSSENKDFDPHNKEGNGILTDFVKKQDFDVEFVLKGSVDSMSELTNNAQAYDAVWLSNSQWILMGDTHKKVKNQQGPL